VAKTPASHQANEAYALHAPNSMVELLAAAKNLQENWERNLTEPMARLNEAIAMAQDLRETLAEPRLRSTKLKRILLR